MISLLAFGLAFWKDACERNAVETPPVHGKDRDDEEPAVETTWLWFKLGGWYFVYMQKNDKLVDYLGCSIKDLRCAIGKSLGEIHSRGDPLEEDTKNNLCRKTR